MLLDVIPFVFWMPLEAVRGVRRIWILHKTLKTTPCPDAIFNASVHVRMGTATTEYDDCDQDCGLGAWCAMILFLKDPYLNVRETTWFKIENAEGQCLAHARRFPDGRFQVIKSPKLTS